MAGDIVEQLFGPSELAIRQQQQAAIDQAAMQHAQMSPLQRAAGGMFKAGAGIGDIGAGMLGFENPQIAQSRANQNAVAGLDIGDPKEIMRRASMISDPKLKMRLMLMAKQLQKEQEKAAIEAQKAALGERKQDFAENQAFELKVMEADAKIRQNDARIADARTSASERMALARESNEIKKMIALAMIEQKRAAAEEKKDKKPSLSATAQKELFDADEAVMGADAGVRALDEALAINKKAMGFKGAGLVADVGSILPDAVRPKTIDTTLDLDNIIQQSVLPQLRSIFGANPTEGERKILLEVAGSSSKPAKVREGIFNRAKRAAELRSKFNKAKADRLRSGTYFNGAELDEPTVAEVPVGQAAPREFKVLGRKQ